MTHRAGFEAYGSGYDDVQRRLPDVRRVEALLGWRPGRSLDDVLDRVVSVTEQGSSSVA